MPFMVLTLCYTDEIGSTTSCSFPFMLIKKPSEVSIAIGSSNHLANRHRTVHQILGCGLARGIYVYFMLRTPTDVILWGRKNVKLGILLVTFAAWVVFKGSG
ncbi:hypothetical protein SAY86_027919 [Trapa natans]|uniref:Uncharacterized protein n=1 Tax=Trapa natans TaxID=22666 RepID=A0AAN7MF15_TRANT|nr:hypothetical protein SAY86_027919 [Trapa natans]